MPILYACTAHSGRRVTVQQSWRYRRINARTRTEPPFIRGSSYPGRWLEIAGLFEAGQQVRIEESNTAGSSSRTIEQHGKQQTRRKAGFVSLVTSLCAFFQVRPCNLDSFQKLCKTELHSHTLRQDIQISQELDFHLVISAFFV
ncbi:hypothetical protein PWP93_27025 [Paraburkholderia sp. A1RI-2L]|uniref:hypothetical protein n=1 Tax=Paraburkholderia sp. A1RI-2L TaxID=3028367 RepID=UPI003B77ED72